MAKNDCYKPQNVTGELKITDGIIGNLTDFSFAKQFALNAGSYDGNTKLIGMEPLYAKLSENSTPYANCTLCPNNGAPFSIELNNNGLNKIEFLGKTYMDKDIENILREIDGESILCPMVRDIIGKTIEPALDIDETECYTDNWPQGANVFYVGSNNISKIQNFLTGSLKVRSCNNPSKKTSLNLVDNQELSDYLENGGVLVSTHEIGGELFNSYIRHNPDYQKTKEFKEKHPILSKLSKFLITGKRESPLGADKKYQVNLVPLNIRIADKSMPKQQYNDWMNEFDIINREDN